MTNHSTPPNTKTHTGTPTYRFLRLAAVCEMSGLSRSQIYRLQAAGLFPKSVKLGQSASAWVEAEISQWQADRIAASRQTGSTVTAAEIARKLAQKKL